MRLRIFDLPFGHGPGLRIVSRMHAMHAPRKLLANIAQNPSAVGLCLILVVGILVEVADVMHAGQTWDV